MTRKNRIAERFHALLFYSNMSKRSNFRQIRSIIEETLHYNIPAFLIACPAQLVEDLLEQRMFKAEDAERN
jgi:hypothetical protein